MVHLDLQTTLYIAATCILTGAGVLALLLRADRHRMRRDPATPGTDTADQGLGGGDAWNARLLQTVEDAPMLVWHETPEGRITWANAAYRALVVQAGYGEPDTAGEMPLVHLFPPDAENQADDGPPGRVAVHHRTGERTWWFECQAQQAGDGTMLRYAVYANPVVRAEDALRNFVQTLTQTFAHLTIGLAIFDRDRQLALFNPALSELTRLPPDWLSTRPTLYAVLDRLRDMRMMPEPKDYGSWRQRMADLEKAATDGTYEETWLLPTGQTYRVIGRPHPEGAVAFLFEDITAEVSLKRRFRFELELSQSVLDSLEQAVAVFSSSGRLVVSNAAYAGLWGVDPSTTLGEIGILESIRAWEAATEPCEAWARVHNFASRSNGRQVWTAQVCMPGDAAGKLHCRFVPLARGATLCTFMPDTAAGRADRADAPALVEPD